MGKARDLIRNAREDAIVASAKAAADEAAAKARDEARRKAEEQK